MAKKCKYEVIVGNIGMVYCGNSKKEAVKHFDDYKALSMYSSGSRAEGEDVTLFENYRRKDGSEDTDIMKEYIPEGKFDEDVI